MLRTFSIVGYAAMVAGLAALFATHNLVSPSPLAIVPQVLAVGLMIWARTTFGRRSFHLAADPTEGGLITTGPYRFIRHPIYAAVCLFAAAGVAANWSWPAAVIGGVVLAGSLVRMRCEEILLVRQFPQYIDYARQTRRLVPFVF